MSINDGGPAFPGLIMVDVPSALSNETRQVQALSPGMTLRDYFAAKAMQAHLSNPKTTENPAFDREGLVIEAYAIADAMLKQRKIYNA